jgi:hypothetical protein
MTSPSWLDDERSFALLPRQAFWLLRRGARRPLAVVLGALASAALVLLALLVERRSYEPRIVLRVTEANADPGSTPELKRRLAEYVREGALTSAPLLELVHRFGLYPKLDPQAAVQAFRRDIDVDVYQNYFVEPRSEGDTPRSARVAVSYRGKDRETAIAVTSELGAIVVARVRATREEQAARAATAARRNSEQLENSLVERYGDIASARRRLAQTWAPKDQVALVSLTGSLPALEQRVTAAERRAGALALGAAYEAHGVGLTFDVADEPSVPVSDPRLPLHVLAAVAAFLCGLPLVVIGAGAGLFSREAT